MHKRSDIVVHLTHATDGLETDGLDVEASETRFHKLVQDALMRAFTPRSVYLHMHRQSAPAIRVQSRPDDVSDGEIEAVIERIWLEGAWRVAASGGET